MTTPRVLSNLFLLSWCLYLSTISGHAAPAALDGDLSAATLAVVINDDDPHSVEVGAYYRSAREIPDRNVIHVHIPNAPHVLSPAAFRKLKDEIDAQLAPTVQAIVMVWTAPYAVACNSITGAMTLGFNAALCENTCAPSAASAYYNALTSRPYTNLGLRPSMLLPTDSVALAKALIDRGVQSEFRILPASAWFLTTSDHARNARSGLFPPTGLVATKKLTMHNVHRDSISDVRDIMIYQTGLPTVAGLDTLTFRPGALADHLTSSGGDLLGSFQMSSLRWLEAGATASYGTVSEPCNYWQKFPNPTVLTRRYLSGDSAIEAYWKSVAWPAQGIFIGEPLARPYRQ